MKLLIVFVSALVMVAQGKAAPSNDEDRVPQIQAEVDTGYAVVDAGQEAGGAEPQAEFSEAVLAVDEPRVVGAGPQRAFGLEEFAGDEPEVEVKNKKSKCDDKECDQRCRRLRLPGGVCINGRCQCDRFFNEEVPELNAYAPQTVYIPIISRACTNSSCVNICNLLGFKNGVCLSTTTCQCYN